MLARVLTRRDEPRLALALTVFAPLTLACVVIDDFWNTALFQPPGFPTYFGVAVMIALAGIGPWFAWRKAGAIRRVSCEPGKVTAGSLVIHAGELTALRIVSGARGKSVAVARGRSVVFFEVERADEAARLAKALGVPAPFGELALTPSKRWPAVFQALVTSLSVAFAALYLLSAVVSPVLFEGKTIFGLGGVIASFASLAVLLARSFGRGEAVALGASRWDAHVALHLHKNENGEDVPEVVDDDVAPRPVSRLGRGNEPTAAWLARLDALPSDAHAYRSDALPADSLWETLGDGEAPVDARMAAARVLRLRFHEEPKALVRVVDDGDVRERIEAALEEHEEAEQHLERLGPLFRAR